MPEPVGQLELQAPVGLPQLKAPPAQQPPLHRLGRLLAVHGGVQIGHQLADQVAQLLPGWLGPLWCQLAQLAVEVERLLELLEHQRPLALGGGGGARLAAMAGQGHHQGQQLVGGSLAGLLQRQAPELGLGFGLERQLEQLGHVEPESGSGLAGVGSGTGAQ